MPISLRVLGLGYLISSFTFAGVTPFELDVEKYFSTCAQKMGKVPEVDCSKDGTEVPITVNGKKPEAGAPIPNCDHPPLLPNSQGCFPFSRLIRRSVGDVDTMMMCRKTHLGTKDDGIFQDIGVIQRNRKTGEVCFFQNNTAPKKMKISYPGEPGWTKRKDGWGAGSQCLDCHGGRVWLRSPFIAQVKGEDAVPWEPFPGRATEPVRDDTAEAVCVNNSAYDRLYPPTEKEKTSLASAGACTSCHQLGGKRYFEVLVEKGILSPSKFASNFAKEFQQAHWMPPTLPKVGPPGEKKALTNAEEYRAYFRRALEAVKRCSEDVTLKATVEGKKVAVCSCVAEDKGGAHQGTAPLSNPVNHRPLGD